MHNAPEANHRDGFRNMVGGIVLVARAFACSLEVFLHRPGTLGERYFSGLESGLAAVLIAIWPAFCEPVHDFSWMYFFLGLYLVLCLAHRAHIAIRVKRGGQQPHTRYSGESWLARIFSRMDEGRLKTGAEPLVAFAVGGLLLAVSPPVGGYVMVASAGLLISTGLAAGHVRQRVLDMHDASIDQANVVDRFRNQRGGR